MTYIKKPAVRHPGSQRNEVGLTRHDYEGSMSTLCAGCGHDSVTAAITRAFFELSIEPYRVAKLSGIGCSAKTPTYFLGEAHGLNAVHGRMPSVTTGASAANRDLVCIGISGDGDSLSIGLGQLSHGLRRNVNMLYVLENNGVYGLTKGQFSASADVGSKAKGGKVNIQPPIDPVLLALNLGATFVARSFSGDKEQLVPLLKAGLAHKGLALIDVISPCVTFNDHEGSTKSYLYTRQQRQDVAPIDFVPLRSEIETQIEGGSVRHVRMHDGSIVRIRKIDGAHDTSDRAAAYGYVQERQAAGEVLTGLFFLDETSVDMHDRHGTTDVPLSQLPFGSLCPGSEALTELQKELR
ncbi:MAG: 2-oxoacid:ferredoxin oxidoreductase subunit beta [Gemmatimonadota bacterium]